uniref:Uncharacterized protein n=1 Tax=Geospiza parvula TaxID=87175 RepID=A0A8U8BD14_GEOPR
MLYCPCVDLRGQSFSGTAWCHRAPSEPVLSARSGAELRWESGTRLPRRYRGFFGRCLGRRCPSALLLELQRAAGTGNDRCADCGDPEWASYKLGIFICLNCSGIHRNLPEISRVKSLRLDFWERNLIEFMRNHGNLWAKAKYEAKVPPFYYTPKSHDCM